MSELQRGVREHAPRMAPQPPQRGITATKHPRVRGGGKNCPKATDVPSPKSLVLGSGSSVPLSERFRKSQVTAYL